MNEDRVPTLNNLEIWQYAGFVGKTVNVVGIAEDTKGAAHLNTDRDGFAIPDLDEWPGIQGKRVSVTGTLHVEGHDAGIGQGGLPNMPIYFISNIRWRLYGPISP